MPEEANEKIICSKCGKDCMDEKGKILRNFIKPTPESEAVCFECKYGCEARSIGALEDAIHGPPSADIIIPL